MVDISIVNGIINQLTTGGHHLVYTYSFIWVNYNDLTATSLESKVIREIIPKWALIQVREIL